MKIVIIDILLMQLVDVRIGSNVKHQLDAGKPEELPLHH
jgi:hypothetical protein